MELLRLKDLLKEKGITGKVLAERTEISATSISQIVKGNSFPRPELLVKIAEVLDVDIRELFYPTKETSAKDLFVQGEDGSFQRIGIIKNLN